MNRTGEYTLMSITLMDYRFPPDMKNLNITSEEVMWEFHLSFDIQRSHDSQRLVRYNLSYKLYYTKDPKKKQVALIEISTIFNVKGDFRSDEKYMLIMLMLNITHGNLTGIYAAKTEGSKLSLILPPPHGCEQYETAFKTKIADEWT